MLVWFGLRGRVAACNCTVARCDFIARFSRAAKPRDKVARVTSALVTLPARTVRYRSVYVTIRCLSVCQSVCLSRLAPRRAARLLLWARRPGDQSINQREICRAPLYETSRSANSSQWYARSKSTLLCWRDIDRLLHGRRSAAAAPQQTSCSECHVVI